MNCFKLKSDFKEIIQKYEIDETDIVGLKKFVSQFNQVIDSLNKSISYSENIYLFNLLLLERTSKNLRKIELVKGSLNSMKEKQLEWKDDLELLTKTYRKEIKKYSGETYNEHNQISMF